MIGFVDLVFNFDWALMLHGAEAHVSLLYLPHNRTVHFRDVKYAGLTSGRQIRTRPDLRSPGFGFVAGSRDSNYLAILRRSGNRDQVNIITPGERGKAFWPLTQDAQGLVWSPNGDHILAV